MVNNSINLNQCQILKILKKEDNWVLARVKAKLIGGKRWKLKTVLLYNDELRHIKLNNII
jgi:hypothetical protein